MSKPSQEAGSRRSRKVWILVLLLSLLLLLLGAAIYIFLHPWWGKVDPGEFHSLPSLETTAGALPSTIPTEAPSQPIPETTEALNANPVDFAALEELNDDIYAWFYLPLGPDRADIDLPLLQAPPELDDNYYLHHDLNKRYRFAGSLYTQRANALDFSDRVTVIYGHNMLDGTMFSDLVYFRNKDFFRDHEFFYIYTPGHVLTYRIAAAVQFDTRHILNSFDFSDDLVYSDWIENYIRNPKSMIRAVREDVEVTLEDRLVILSTCLDHGASRYLIQGVLINDEPTS